MLKRLVVWAMAALLLSCEGDIETTDATAPGEQGALFMPGEKWSIQRTERRISGISYKVEEGQSELCEYWQIYNGTACTADVSASYYESEFSDAVTIVAQSNLASIAAPGYFVRQNSNGSYQTGAYLVNDDLPDNLNDPEDVNLNSVYTLAEYNGFIIRQAPAELGFDYDAGKGVALYPAHPEPGHSYTTDAGETWTALGTESFEYKDGNLSAVLVTNAVDKSLDIRLEDYAAQCVVTEQAPWDPDFLRVNLVDECQNSRLLRGWTRLWIKDAHLVKSEKVRAFVSIEDAGFRGNWGLDYQVYAPGGNPTSPLVVVLSVRLEREESVITDWQR